MTIDLSQWLPIVSALIAVVSLFMAVKKNNKGDSVETGRMLEKLDNIEAAVADIKAEMRETKAESRETKDEFYAQSVKYAELETRMKNIEKTISNNKKEGEK